jgi:photosynthetic reaction center cytochrome c subunit
VSDLTPKELPPREIHMRKGIQYALALIGITGGTLLTIVLLLSFERPPIVGVQRGYRGTAMDQIYNPRTIDALASALKIPRSLPPASPAGVKAAVAYKNVKVLGNLSVGQFTRLMVSITTWVAPKQGCAYCHNVANMADDTNYTKIVARRMIQMTQNINANWQSHVQNVGVTCYTCHGGNPVPKNIWFNDPGPEAAGGITESNTGMAHPTKLINYSSLPYDPFTPYLEQSDDIRVQGTTALPSGNLSSIKETEWTYALMIHFSQSLGVNCTYCHNTEAFGNWAISSPARVTAWYGIRMVRNVNNDYLDPLNGVFPAYRKGVLGDSPKVNCATCHQGLFKPLYGVSMLKTFPELKGPTIYQAAAVTPAPAPAAAPAAPAPAAPAVVPAAPPAAAPVPPK